MSEAGPKLPIGIYTYEDDIPGVESHEIPSNRVTRVARDFWGMAERIDDLIPGAGDAFRWINPFD